MKRTKYKINKLDERYKSTADNGLWETWVSLYEVTDPKTLETTYGVLINTTFDDGVETYDNEPEGEVFADLESAREYFNTKTVGMYRSPEEEFLAAFNCLKPKQKATENIQTGYVDLFNEENN